MSRAIERSARAARSKRRPRGQASGPDLLAEAIDAWRLEAARQTRGRTDRPTPEILNESLNAAVLAAAYVAWSRISFDPRHRDAGAWEAIRAQAGVHRDPRWIVFSDDAWTALLNRMAAHAPGRGRDPALELGTIYERLLSRPIRWSDSRPTATPDASKRKILGAFFTPPMIVNWIVRAGVGGALREQRRGAVRPVRILDPACGGGALLIGAIRLMLHERRRRESGQADDPAAIASLVKASIFGIDLDPIAASLARLAIAMELRPSLQGMPLDLGGNIIHGNSLIGPGDACVALDIDRRKLETEAGPLIDWEKTFGGPRGGHRFDVVIANPPYQSYSGRQRMIMPDRLKRFVEANFHGAASGAWRSSHGLFIEQAVRRLARRCVAMVVPTQVFQLAGYAPVRRILDEQACLRSIRHWGDSRFGGVVMPVSTFVVDVATAPMPRTSFSRKPRSTPNVLDRLMSLDGTLGPLVTDIGVHTGNCASKLIVDQPVPGASCVPVLEGKDIQAYAVSEPKRWLRMDYVAAPSEYFRIPRPAAVDRIAGVIRQTAAWPIAARLERPIHFRNSLLGLLDPGEGVDVRFLIGLLNARAICVMHRLIAPDSGQAAFPQVKIRDLRRLPLRLPDQSSPTERQMHGRVVKLVKAVEAFHKSSTSSLEKRKASDKPGRPIRHVLNEIDRIVESWLARRAGMPEQQVFQAFTASDPLQMPAKSGHVGVGQDRAKKVKDFLQFAS